MKDVKGIYQSINEQLAKEVFNEFKATWNDKYQMAVKSWEMDWDNLIAFLQQPQGIRKLIYKTNIIESFNASLRKYNRNKKVFPNDESV